MKRNWWLLGIIVVFIIVYEIYVVRPHFREKIQQAQTQAPAHSSQTLSATTTTSSSAPAAPAVTKMETPKAQSISSKTVELSKNSAVKFFDAGQVGSLELKNYFQRNEKNKSVVLFPAAFSWTSSNTEIQNCLAGLRMSSSEGRVFLYQNTSGTNACEVKYTVDEKVAGLFNVEVILRGFSSAEGGIEFTTTEAVLDGAEYVNSRLGWNIDTSTKFLHGQKAIAEAEVPQGALKWASFGDKYFAGYLLPKDKFIPTLVKRNPLSVDTLVYGFRYNLLPAPEGLRSYQLSLYMGERDPDKLNAVQLGLDESVEFGFFPSVSKALLWGLNKINLLVANYGFAIIVLTLIVRAAFWPMNRKVFVSGQKMKELAPEIEKIRKKYGDDRSKALQMNQEIMGIYKKNKVSPMGGCLPLLAQLPIFIGLYGALSNSMDLYQAPFVGWIHDLSSRDPFFVFPILWTVSLFLYVKLTPQPPTQPGMPDMRLIQYGMNLVIGFMSKDWPAGLTLYLFVSNLVGIIQQYLMQKTAKLTVVQEGA